MISKQDGEQNGVSINLSHDNLEKTYRQLEENIKQRFQALALQHQLIKIQSQKQISQQRKTTLDYLKQSHKEMQNFYSQNLLNSQVIIQEQQQMRLIIKNYQQRISQLRGVLVNKQAEISYQMYQKKRHSIIRKQSITCLNNQVKVERQIKKTFDQLKKIKVQIEAIEHAIQYYQSELSTNQQTQRTSIAVQKCCMNIQTFNFKQKLALLQKDKNVSKIISIIHEQMKRNELLKEQQHKLKQEYEKASNLQNKNIARYRQQIQNNLIKHEQNILDSINQTFTIQEQSDQQSKEETLKVEKIINHQLFSQRDINKVQKNGILAKKNKGVTLKEKRMTSFKQN